MKPSRWISAGLLLLLAGGVAAGWLRTRELPVAAPVQADPGKAQVPGQGRGRRRPLLVDETPIQTAKALAALPMAAEEQAFALQAVQLANHEVDIAFADVLRRAVDRPPAPTPETQGLFTAKAQAEASLRTEQATLAVLEAELAKAREAARGDLEDRITVQKAQVDLAKDELEDAEADLEKAGLDPQASIQRLIEAHKAAEQVQAEHETPLALPFQVQAGSLVARYRSWSLLHRKALKLAEAERAAQARGPWLLEERAAFLKRLAEREAARREAAAQAGAEAAPKTEAAPKSAAQKQVDDLKRKVRRQRVLTGFTKRAQDARDQAQVYGAWGDRVEAQARLALHGLLGKAFWILLVLGGVFLAGFALEHRPQDDDEDLRRARAVRTVLKVAVQVLGLLVIGFLLFGAPGQATTILGLAGAGLTVALKDFIVAFFGWFLLMGRNGIHVGDWVEIKGVGGEVVEIGLLRTVLLETGSWNDAGHPTGRRVAFVNSFAIDGHYFNFTTTGQWMWDELTLLIPPGQDPYPVLAGVRRLVEQETDANARRAEAEWQQATTRYRVKAFSAVPGIQIVPTALGVEIHARYITRAHERHETRQRLNQAVVELLHGKPEGKAEPAAGDVPA